MVELSRNPNAIHLLEHAHYGGNPDKIHRGKFSKNPSIFEYDYQAMKNRMYDSILIIYVWKGWGFEDILSPVKD